MKEVKKLPHWDLAVVYPSLENEEFGQDFDHAIQAINALAQQFDEWHINRMEHLEVDQQTVQRFDTIVTQFNQILEKIITLRSYIMGHLTTDSRNTAAQAKYSELQPHLSRLSLLGTRLTAWIGSMPVETLISQSEVAQDHAYMIRRAKIESDRLMDPQEEALASDLKLTGSSSWSKLFSTYSSQLMVEIEIEGEQQTLPLTAAQNLGHHKDREVRQQAYENVMTTLRKAAVPMAAALNAIKGETLTLSQRRGWDDPLDKVLFDNAIDRETFDAMQQATRAAFPDFRRYLRARAKALGIPVLRWYDRLAPLGESSQSWAYEDATQFVVKQFGTYSDKMRGLAERAFSEGWVDAEPREGKRGGAFCMLLRQDESRILANFQPSFDGVGTLAHELGHAYHNLTLAHRSPLQKNLPMTLAETASTFCQKIVENAALKKADAKDQLIILDGLLEYATRVVIGATSNFIFEQSVFEKRAQRELSIDEFCELDVAAQKQGTGDAVDPDYLHPYRWAYVPHYYLATYYNFPYTFGLLFGLGLYAQYQNSPDTFKQGYDELLSMTGMANADQLAERFGIDVRSRDFWEASLDLLRRDIDRFESLVDTVQLTV